MPLIRSLPVRLVAILFAVSLVVIPSLSAAADNSVPTRLAKIEALLQQIADDVALPPPVPQTQTRLLFPFVTNQAGFDTGISIANTGLDSTGTIGQAGKVTIHYYGTVAGSPGPFAPQTTTADILPGASVVFVVSTGGGNGITGLPGFQGYIEVVCDFPFAHGFSLITDGPIGAARVGTTGPALVLPNVRTNAYSESLGQ